MSASVTCKPCSDEEVLLAVCSSDFGKYVLSSVSIALGIVWNLGPDVNHKRPKDKCLLTVCVFVAGVGSFEGVVTGPSGYSSAVASLSRLFRQKGGTFARSTTRGRRWRGRVNVPKQCGAPPGADVHLLTGSIHFGEAWLGCAPRYRDFLKLYTQAEGTGTNPCQVDVG